MRILTLLASAVVLLLMNSCKETQIIETREIITSNLFQVGAVTGKVSVCTKQCQIQPAVGCRVELVQKGLTRFTDSTGYFEFDSIPPGVYKLKFTQMGVGSHYIDSVYCYGVGRESVRVQLYETSDWVASFGLKFSVRLDTLTSTLLEYELDSNGFPHNVEHNVSRVYPRSTVQVDAFTANQLRAPDFSYFVFIGRSPNIVLSDTTTYSMLAQSYCRAGDTINAGYFAAKSGDSVYLACAVAPPCYSSWGPFTSTRISNFITQISAVKTIVVP